MSPTKVGHAAEIAVAADAMRAVTDKITDQMLDRPTPCADTDLGTLLAHIIMLSSAFTAAARKELGPLTASPPPPSTSVAGTQWRSTLTRDLAVLADSWHDPAAWEGMTQAGGVDAPAEILGTVALSELVLHGWDVARSIGVEQHVPDHVRQIVFDFHFPPQPQEQREGMFGPVVDVPDDAPLVDRLAGLAGRDPYWPHGNLEE